MCFNIEGAEMGKRASGYLKKVHQLPTTDTESVDISYNLLSEK